MEMNPIQIKQRTRILIQNILILHFTWEKIHHAQNEI